MILNLKSVDRILVYAVSVVSAASMYLAGVFQVLCGMAAEGVKHMGGDRCYDFRYPYKI